jgi:hypothetical protein
MGRSLVPVAAAASRPRDAAHHNPFEDLHSRFLVEVRGDRVWHRQTRLGPAGEVLYEREAEVHYALGSGTLGHSYLTDRDGFLFQTAISWFTQKQAWDLSPAFRTMPVPSRPVGADCLFCHANRALHRPESFNGYEPPVFRGAAIGCERCHGPGEKHVRSSARLDIVNPARLEGARREAVCEQCHLQGEARVVRRGRRLDEFRPGLALQDFVSVFVSLRKPAGGQRAVNHVEQMYESGCYRGGRADARLGCVSCHDPHVYVGPERRQAHYRERCLKCHQTQGCSAPAADRRARADSCIDCHMPRQGSSDIAHTAVTDHRIRRRPAAPAESVPTPPEALPGHLPVAAFRREGAATPDGEISRDLGLALVGMMAQGKLDMAVYPGQALPLLQEAARRHPDDVEALQALADTLILLRRPAEALRTVEAALRHSPGREMLLARAGQLAQDLGDREAALGYWRRAAAANPWLSEPHAQLATLLAGRGAWEEARTRCRDWLRLDPESVPARLLWVRCLLHDGNRTEARAEVEKLALLQPGSRERLEGWFAEQTREAPAR